MGNMQTTMKECMGTDNLNEGVFQEDQPLVSIVLATYNPRLDWLKEQLDSLESQSYRPLELLILDDCSAKISIEELQAMVKDCIKSIPYQIMQNEKNIGSTKTFEKLTNLAVGEYIAYCDQDDVWHGEKIRTCVRHLNYSETKLVYSDMNIVDGDGKFVADSITRVRRHHKFHSGKGLAEKLLFHNFVTGCTILIGSDIAKQAIPFCPYMVHDHWLALYAAQLGKITFINQSLINYRIHANNQTLMMAGVKDKESYVKLRISESLDKFLWLQDRIEWEIALKDTIVDAIEWTVARDAHFEGSFRSVLVIWKYRHFSPVTVYFELVAPYLPTCLFLFAIYLKKRNVL